MKDTATLNEVYNFVDDYMEDEYIEGTPVWVYELDKQRQQYELEIQKLKRELKNKEHKYDILEEVFDILKMEYIDMRKTLISIAPKYEERYQCCDSDEEDESDSD